MEILDSSVKELRRVAHNMMPEALLKFGLKEALGDFCVEIDTPQMKVGYHYYGEKMRLSQNIEIALYRIAQELINNALKHSNASEINVQLLVDYERASLTVQDNGQGFDLGATGVTGFGLNSIRSRVAALNGIIDISSDKGRGTEIEIEFTI